MKKNIKKKIFFVVVALIVLAIVSFFLYFNDYYSNQLENSNFSATVKEFDDYYFIDGSSTDSALIFYQGGKVDETAYLELMRAIADKGVDCFLLKMPFNFALFGIDKAECIIDNYNYDFYVGGHSLGGVCASMFAEKNADKLKGLVLFASYSNKDLSNFNIEVLSIYGSNDSVLNMEEYQKALVNLPVGFNEQIIEGGNHSYFGTYGLQKGDQEASITNYQQLVITSEMVTSFILD